MFENVVKQKILTNNCFCRDELYNCKKLCFYHRVLVNLICCGITEWDVVTVP